MLAGDNRENQTVIGSVGQIIIETTVICRNLMYRNSLLSKIIPIEVVG
jgi:hypothetical protein